MIATGDPNKDARLAHYPTNPDREIDRPFSAGARIGGLRRQIDAADQSRARAVGVPARVYIEVWGEAPPSPKPVANAHAHDLGARHCGSVNLGWTGHCLRNTDEIAKGTPRGGQVRNVLSRPQYAPKSAALESPKPDRDALITGIPRSGTSFAAALIDYCLDAICLSEPLHQFALMEHAATAPEFVRALALDFASLRRHLNQGGAVADRRASDGGPITNYFSTGCGDGSRVDQSRVVERRKPGLEGDFLLAVKHNALFAAALPEIMESGSFAVIAIVRDPVRVIASWRSLELPVSSGRLPAAEKFWPEMTSICGADIDLLDKHIMIYDCFCRRFAALPQLKVLKFDEFSLNRGLLLNALGLRESPNGARVRTTWSPARDRPLEDAIRRRVCTLCRAGTVPGLVSYYPEYATP
jgi:hypothetical protein